MSELLDENDIVIGNLAGAMFWRSKFKHFSSYPGIGYSNNNFEILSKINPSHVLVWTPNKPKKESKFQWSSLYRWNDRVNSGAIDLNQKIFWESFSNVIQFWEISDIHPWEIPSNKGYHVLISK